MGSDAGIDMLNDATCTNILAMKQGCSSEYALFNDQQSGAPKGMTRKYKN